MMDGQINFNIRPQPLTKVKYEKEASVEERFLCFHEANPHVARALAKRALQLKRAGRKRYGMKALFETLRFFSSLQSKGDPYKLNNSYTTLYARLIMEKMPELEGFFETRDRE